MKQELKIGSTVGLHARLASEVVRCASKYEADIELHYNDKIVDVKSILGLMSLAIPSGDNVVLVATGIDADIVVEEIKNILE